MSRVNGFRGGRAFPATLRLFTVSARFLLIFFLARLLPVEEVGLYGLLTATLSFVVFALGFDFYTYSTRQVLRESKTKWRTFLRSQAAFSLVLYATIGPLLLVVFTTGLLPWHLAIWFFMLLPLEHLGLEVDRLLIAMSDQLGASIGLFFRQATVLLLIPLILLVPDLRTLTSVLSAWLLFDMLGLAVGLIFVSRRLPEHPRGRIDWTWIRTGAKIAVPFLIGTLCLRALFTFDRQVVALFSDLQTLGAYTFFISIGAGMTQVLYAGVQQFAYPKLVTSAHLGDRRGFVRSLASLGLQTVAGIVLITGGVVLLQPLILGFVGGDAYAQHAWMLPWVMLVTGLYNLSLVPHFGLYALDADRTILWSTVGAFTGFAATAAILVRTDAVVAVLAGVGLGSLILLVAKGVSLFARCQGPDAFEGK